MNFLPNIGDPAGSPRVIAEPRDNPYIPKGMRQRASMKPVHRMIDPRVGIKELVVNGIKVEFLYPLFKPVQVPSVLYLVGGGH